VSELVSGGGSAAPAPGGGLAPGGGSGPAGSPSGIVVRPAREDELDAAGAVVAEAYLTEPGMGPHDSYLEHIRDARGRADDTDVLVAVDGSGAILGCVSYVRDHTSPFAEVEHDGEAGFRMLGVAPSARGRGVGTALVEACLARARAAGKIAVAITSGDGWEASHRVYARLGFVRAPDRDFDPVPGVSLIAWVRPLAAP
jgi:GNAT superfamily N-acetyltransferase